MKRFHRFFGNYEPVSGCILSCFKMISAWFFFLKNVCVSFFSSCPSRSPPANSFQKKECSRFRQASRFGCKGVCVFIWGMFHEFTYSMMIIIHDFCSGGTDSPSVVFLRRREGGLPGSVVVSPREVLHEESMPVASLSDLLRSPFRGRNRKSFRFASLSDLLSSPLRGSHLLSSPLRGSRLLRHPPEEGVPIAAGGARQLAGVRMCRRKSLEERGYSLLLISTPAARSPSSAPRTGAGAWVRVGWLPGSVVDTGAAVVVTAVGAVVTGALVGFPVG